MNNIIPVFFSSDDNYAPYLSVALASLIDNADKDRIYHLYVLEDGLSQENQKRLKALEKDHFTISFVPMKERLGNMNEKVTNRLRCDYFTMTIYFRIFIPDMFPEYDRGIYLDSDIAVPGDISKLYDTDLEGKPLGACIDLSIQDVPPLTRYIDEAVGVDHRTYVNSGVLLMDMKKLRDIGFADRFLYLLNTYRFDSIAPDQDYINAMFGTDICHIDNVWDLYPDNSKPEEKEPQLIHYNLFSKPWCYEGIQYEEYFWKYARLSGFYDECRAHLDHYTEEDRRRDAACQTDMGTRGNEIVEKGIRFSDVFNTGKESRLS